MRARLTVLGLVAFALLDVVLVYLAVAHVRDAAPAGAAVSAPSPTSSPTSGSTDSSSDPTGPPATGDPTGPPATGSARRLLLESAPGVVLRATRGSCAGDTPGSIELATSGEDFSVVAGDTGVVEILSLEVLSRQDLAFAGADEACQVSRYVSTDGGASWDQAAADTGWRLSLDGDRTVQSPTGPVQPGCTVRSVHGLAPLEARVLCRNRDVMGTVDGGTTWEVISDDLPGLVAVAYRDLSLAYALASTKDCPAGVYATLDAGTTWTPTACLEGEQPQALAVDPGGRAVAQVDGAIQVSTNGASWRAW